MAVTSVASITVPLVVSAAVPSVVPSVFSIGVTPVVVWVSPMVVTFFVRPLVPSFAFVGGGIIRSDGRYVGRYSTQGT